MGGARDPRDNEALAKYNLTELVNLCMFCQTNFVPYALSPGFCIPEVAPNNFEKVRTRYDEFFVLHNIQLYDDIESQSATPILETQNILSLPADEIKFRALPFLYICCMLLVNVTEKNKSPAEKFTQFMNLIVEYVGYFSEKELLVAKIVIGDISNRSANLFDKDELDLIKNIENNFSKTKKRKNPETVADLIKIAFNGANDFSMINAAVATDNGLLSGERNDSWLMTNDLKLINYLSKLFGYAALIPGQNGMIAELNLSRGFKVALLEYDVELLMRKIDTQKHRQLIRFDSDLWVIRVREMLNLLGNILPKQ